MNTPADLCPVCCFSLAHGRNTYCSEQCRKIAYNFRKRLSGPLSYLATLNFAHAYSNGVLLTLALPTDLQYAYPLSLASFTFPDPCVDLTLLSIDDFWQELEWNLGKLITDVLRFLYNQHQRDIPGLGEDMLLYAMEQALMDRSHSFHCARCQTTYIDSLYSREGPHLCAACADPIPAEKPF